MLTNDNKCVMSWIRGRTLITGQMDVPTVDGYRFTRTEKAFGMSNVTWTAVDFNDASQDNSFKLEDTMEHLFIDCYASLRNQLVFELVDLVINEQDEPLLMTESEQVVASRDITNDGMTPLTLKVDLDPERNSFLEIYHQVSFNSTFETKWRVIDSPFNKILLTSVGSGIELESLLKNLVSNGQVSLKIKEKILRFSQDVTVAPETHTQILIKIKVLRGSFDFVAKYRIAPKMNAHMWSTNRMLQSLKRAGFPEWNRMVEENGTLTISYPGHFAIDTSFDSHLHIVSEPLVGESAP